MRVPKIFVLGFSSSKPRRRPMTQTIPPFTPPFDTRRGGTGRSSTNAMMLLQPTHTVGLDYRFLPSTQIFRSPEDRTDRRPG